ncbi:unnamed protein product, partial [Ectocarpus sp. 12 AP-2014]
KVDKKTVSYVVAGVFCVYALVYKIPIPCFGCQKNGFWYRCVMDTGEGTASCDAYKPAENRAKTAGRIMDQAGVYMDNLWDFTKTDLPGIITDFIATLKDQILGLKDRLAEKIMQIIAFLQEKLMLFVSKIKQAVVYTYEKFMEVVINPIIKFFVNNLLQPVVRIFEKIIEFRDLVWRVLLNAIDKFANIGIGDVVGEVVDVFKQIPEAMRAVKPFVVKMINTIKNKTIGVVNIGIQESIQGVENSVNFASGKLDDSVNLAVGGLNLVKNELVENLNASINGMSSGIERVVNSTTGVIETSVNKTVGGVTGGINKSMNQVEKGVEKVIGTTNHVIKGAETAVNSITNNINKSMNQVERGVNKIGKGLADGLNLLLSPLRQVQRAVDHVRKVKIGKRWKVLGKRFGFELTPFSRLPSFKAPGKQKQLFEADIPDIKKQKFGRIKANLNIPDVKFDGIKIDDIDIPPVNIKAPKDIGEIDIPDIDIPHVEIPIPADIKEEDLDFPTIPGIGFVSEKVSQTKESIKSIFETAMAPLYDGVAVLISLVSMIISSAVTFFENYLTWTAIKKRVSSILKFAGQGATMLKALVVDEIIPGFIRLMHTIKDPVLEFVKKVTDHTWRLMKKISVSVGKVFNESFRIIAKVTGIIAKGIFHTGLYNIGTTVEKYTGWLPLPLSVKILLIVASIFWMCFGGVLSNCKIVIDVVLAALQGVAVGLVDLDSMLDEGFGLVKTAAAPASSFLF